MLKVTRATSHNTSSRSTTATGFRFRTLFAPRPKKCFTAEALVTGYLLLLEEPRVFSLKPRAEGLVEELDAFDVPAAFSSDPRADERGSDPPSTDFLRRLLKSA
jgi:hypothetical protein